MRSNRSIRIGIALMSGAFLLLVLYLVWQFSRSSRQAARVDANSTTNGVTPIRMRSDRRAARALVDLPARSIITADMFRMDDVPEGMSTAGMVTEPEAQGIGFITRVAIRRNDYIRSTSLVGHISQVGVAGALSPGTRAMVVPIPSKPTLHDLVRVGDTVDIIAAFDGQESRTIVEAVRILAVDIFVKDYPQTTGAMRGPYKAPSVAIRSADPPAPAQTTGQPSTPAAAPQPGQPTPAPTPTPTPTPAPQAAPAPAFTLEVTPEQANRISLAQNSGAAIDFIIVPRTGLPLLAPSTLSPEVRVVAVTRPQLAPYAEMKKGTGAAKPRSTPRAASQTGRNNIRTVSNENPDGYIGPTMPIIETPVLPPAALAASKSTYEIPVYADGKPARTEVVLKPKTYSSLAD